MPISTAMRQFNLSLVVTTKEAGQANLNPCPVRSVVTASIATIHNVKDLYEAPFSTTIAAPRDDEVVFHFILDDPQALALGEDAKHRYRLR